MENEQYSYMTPSSLKSELKKASSVKSDEGVKKVGASTVSMYFEDIVKPSELDAVLLDDMVTLADQSGNFRSMNGSQIGPTIVDRIESADWVAYITNEYNTPIAMGLLINSGVEGWDGSIRRERFELLSAKNLGSRMERQMVTSDPTLSNLGLDKRIDYLLRSKAGDVGIFTTSRVGDDVSKQSLIDSGYIRISTFHSEHSEYNLDLWVSKF